MNNYNDHNLVTFSNSLLRHFGVEPFHQTEQIIDEALGNHKKVVVILFDGMGQNIIRKHLKYNSFIRQHYLCTINSTFPPTTTAATTAFLTGKYPIETGWMAWSQFFEKYNRNIVPFTNKDYNTKEKLNPQNIAFNEMPIRSILELIQEKNPQMHTFNVKRYPIDMDGPKTLGDLRRKIKKSLKGVKKCLGYFYYDEPDGRVIRWRSSSSTTAPPTAPRKRSAAGPPNGTGHPAIPSFCWTRKTAAKGPRSGRGSCTPPEAF